MGSLIAKGLSEVFFKHFFTHSPLCVVHQPIDPKSKCGNCKSRPCKTSACVLFSFDGTKNKTYASFSVFSCHQDAAAKIIFHKLRPSSSRTWILTSDAIRNSKNTKNVFCFISKVSLADFNDMLFMCSQNNLFLSKTSGPLGIQYVILVCQLHRNWKFYNRFLQISTFLQTRSSGLDF